MGIKEIFKYRRSIVVWKILRNFSKKRENHKDDSFKEKIMSCRNQEISMDAVMNNLFLSKRLYDLLKVKCHPDRFIEPTQKEIATGIYQNITKYKTDYQQLLNIKEQVKEQVNLSDKQKEILIYLLDNPSASLKSCSEATGASAMSIRYTFKKVKSWLDIRHEGPDKTGIWSFELISPPKSK